MEFDSYAYKILINYENKIEYFETVHTPTTIGCYGMLAVAD